MNTRTNISQLIYNRILENKEQLKLQFENTKNSIGYFFVDELLPEELANELYLKFPKIEDTKKRKNLREYKYVAFQMNKYSSVLEETLYAFQDKKVVNLIGEICNLPNLEPDEFLYAGGLSLMGKGNFLNPHLDNSHDKDLQRWRVLNLLYYVTPNWELENGGNLELWPQGMQKSQTTIESKFNRLVVMATHQKSWHSVSKVIKNDTRCCISNYYFSQSPILISDSFHITTFRGRPNERIKNVLLIFDSKIRSFVRKIFKKGIRENPHQYKK